MSVYLLIASVFLAVIAARNRKIARRIFWDEGVSEEKVEIAHSECSGEADAINEAMYYEQEAMNGIDNRFVVYVILSLACFVFAVIKFL